MNNAEFIAEIYSIAWSINPDLDDSSSFQEIVAEIASNKEKAIRWDILQAAFDLPKPEPQLPTFDNSPERWKQMAQDRIGNT